jgi:hypothetical protein
MDKELAILRLAVVCDHLIEYLSAGWLARARAAEQISELQTERFKLQAIIENYKALEKSSATPSAPRGGEGSGAGSEGV